MASATFSYDAGAVGSRTGGPATGIDTVIYTPKACFCRPPRRIYSPFSGLPLRDDALAVFHTLLADSDMAWFEVAAFFTMHPWCTAVWKEVGTGIHRPCWCRAGSPDDIVQSGKLELWASLKRRTNLRAWLEPAKERFHGWTGQLILNMCRHFARRLRRDALGTDKLRRVELVGDEMALDRCQAAPESADETAALLAKIAHLPPLVFQILRLRFVEGLSQNDAAAALGITPDAAKWAIQSCKTQLARALDSDGEATR